MQLADHFRGLLRADDPERALRGFEGVGDGSVVLEEGDEGLDAGVDEGVVGGLGAVADDGERVQVDADAQVLGLPLFVADIEQPWPPLRARGSWGWG
jgi:hypothetical protein